MQEAEDHGNSLVVDSVAFVGKGAVLAGARVVMQGEEGQEPTELVRRLLNPSTWMVKFGGDRQIYWGKNMMILWCMTVENVS